jgi:adenylate cyclase
MGESTHQLAAILFSEIVDYSRRMHEDKEASLTLLRKNRQIHKAAIKRYHGKYLKEMGEGTLAKFDSAIDSVHCALEIQRKAHLEFTPKLRIGIHLGDVTIENEDVFGDGVNIASRLQSITDPGGIYISESIHEAIRAHKDIQGEILGEVHLKNVDHPVKTYFLKDKELPVPSTRRRKELTNSGSKPLLKQVWFYMIIISLLIGFIVTVSWFSKTRGIILHSIAVLPPENLSGKESEKWLAAGIQNGLINELTRIKKLHVVPRRSTLKYDSTHQSILEIAGELEVEGIVKATFLSTRNNLNLQVRLVKTSTEEKQLWRQTYNCLMQNVLVTYSEIARDVAREANIPLTSEEKLQLTNERIVNPAAYQLCLMGDEYASKLSETDLDTALLFYELAQRIDPEYAPAFAGVAGYWMDKRIGGYASAAEAGPKQKAAMKKAISLDSTLFRDEGKGNIWATWDWEAGEKLDLENLALNPDDPGPNMRYAHFLAIMGKPEEGLPYMEKSFNLDRLNPFTYGWYGMSLCFVHRYEEAIEVLEEALSKFPGEMIIYSTLRSAYHGKHMYDEAIEAGIKYYEIRKDSACISALKQGYREGGYQLALQRNAEALIAESKTKYVTPWQVATLYTRAGMKEEALNWLEKAYEEHDSNMPYINADPIFDDIRQDPRFREILRKMKFPE